MLECRLGLGGTCDGGGAWRWASGEESDKKRQGVTGTTLPHQPEGLGLSPEGPREPWEGWEQGRDGVKLEWDTAKYRQIWQGCQ